jgi:hypothetical protein
MTDFFAGAVHGFGLMFCVLVICEIISLRKEDDGDER